MSGPRGSRLPGSNSTQNHGRMIPPLVEGPLSTFAVAAAARLSLLRVACMLLGGWRWPTTAVGSQMASPTETGGFAESYPEWSLHTAPHQGEEAESWCVQDDQMMGTRSSQEQRQDSEGSAGWWFFFYLFPSKMGFVVPANEEVVTLFAENSPTWFQLWVNSPVIRNSSMIS